MKYTKVIFRFDESYFIKRTKNSLQSILKTFKWQSYQKLCINPQELLQVSIKPIFHWQVVSTVENLHDNLNDKFYISFLRLSVKWSVLARTKKTYINTA
jgi:hypothetical protein